MWEAIPEGILPSGITGIRNVVQVWYYVYPSEGILRLSHSCYKLNPRFVEYFLCGGLMKKIDEKFIAKAAIIAALYCVATLLIAPIAFGENQVRISEALNVLVYFTPAAIPGLFVGCILANLSSPFGLIDIALGSLATLLAALVASKIKNKYLVEIPSILFNGVLVGFVLYKMASVPFVAGFLSVCLGQAISLYALGLPLLLIIEKNDRLRNLIADDEE